MARAQLDTLLRYVHKLAAGRGSLQRTDCELLDDFSGRRDESAFAALVARHGAMVLRVCWRVLNHEQDAEDAFQATFLILARKAASIRKREALAEWLHGVAYRTAMELKRSAARRRDHEARLWTVMRKAAVSPTWDDVQAVVDEEVQRLPEALRAAFVLCVLEGKSGPEAARELGVQEGTVSSRLTRARQRLQQRLARRGIQLSALLAALSVAESAGKAAVPAGLVGATIRAGLLVAAGGTAAGLIPSHVASLAAGVTRAMLLTRKIVIAVLLAVGLAAGAGVAARQVLVARERPAGSQPSAVSSQEPGPAAAKGVAKPPAADEKDSLIYAGRVLGPDGQPVPGAKLYLTPAVGYLKRPSPSPEYGVTGPDGRFALTVPKAKFGEQATIVTAAAANHGPGWVEIPADGKRDDLTLRLVDDVPISGQIVDLEAKPVAGATLTVLQINAAPNEDPAPWLEAAKGKKGLSLEFEFEQRYLPRFTVALAPQVTTDAAGRFRLTGLGRNRLARVQLDGPTIASQQLYILTRPGKAVAVPVIDADLESGTPGLATPCYPASFRHVAGPTQPVAGIIRDKDTGKPLPGMTVQSYMLANNPLAGLDLIRTTTDEQGRYRLVGLPKGKGNKILVIPAGDQPYLEASAEVPDPPGVGPVAVNFRLKRGIWIEGRLTDKATDRPAPGPVGYLAQIGNKFVPNFTGYEPISNRPTSNVQKDGTFRVVGLPGPGLLTVVRSGDHYLSARERDDEEGTRDVATKTTPLRVSTEGFSALARVDPPPGAETFRRDVALDPGQTLTGTVLGPDGKPLAGARAYRLAGLGWERSPRKTASFLVRAFNPRRPRLVLFLHPEKRLVGALQPPADKTTPVRVRMLLPYLALPPMPWQPPDKTAPVCVRMRAGAAVVGRLVDADGLPRAKVELLLGIRDWSLDMWVPYFPDKVRTDRDGRFRIEALQPGERFLLSDGRGGETYFGDLWVLGGSLRAGETKDLGDVRMKR